MASGQEIFDASTALIEARATVALRQAEFDTQQAIVSGAITEQQTALEAAQLAFGTAQDAARAATPGWQPALVALIAANDAEAQAVATLLGLTFDGT